MKLPEQHIQADKLVSYLTDRLTGQEPREELQSRILILLEDRLKISRADVITGKELDLTEDQTKLLEADIQKLNRNIPIQHVVGKAHFYGRDFLVNENVLIPRPETEELVHLIISENKNSQSWILDIGTGSGCIPISLKLEMPDSQVVSIDKSSKAIEVAKQNATSLNAEVEFIEKDIFDQPPLKQKFDILVSNPPYIPVSEKEQMQKEVTDNEPEMALFVDDDDPLIFYKAIAAYSMNILKDSGKIYFEIHSKFAEETRELLGGYGFKGITLIKDINGKDRIIAAHL